MSVIPFGINDTTPKTDAGRDESRERLGLDRSAQVLLFFGQIAPYKGLEYLVRATAELAPENPRLRLIIGGRVKPGHGDYWNRIRDEIARLGLTECVVQRVQFIPDEEVEFFFKAADALVIPYVEIFQSGVPFLSYSFGLPVIATDVGSLRDDVLEGETGLLCQAQNPRDLADVICRFFGSSLYENAMANRNRIRSWAANRNSWVEVANIVQCVYEKTLREP